ncbi:hypothetical protein [Cohaesibacter celericrescens]|uniref:DUF4145 domain-containing protein n=1 Tax=Cohaesibacter celericrescens TaxID=2067669 RepID=A0A2N5XTG7_9HYPH|nr:hypothetical protein [Cohaesibacter celericrescens]PLW77770.1 hypothetical protein C0081_07780 [Cohaesibacter celericrescens]
MHKWMTQQHRINEIYDVILFESDRGSVLLACQIIDDALKEILKDLKPNSVSEAAFKKATGRGGPFSSLASKTEALYVIGVLSTQTNSAIKVIREIRNKAAHSSTEFRIFQYEEKLSQAMNLFGEGFVLTSTETALEMFMQKMGKIGKDIKSDLGANPFSTKQECIDYLQEVDSPAMQGLKNMLPNWHVASLTYLIVESIFLNLDDFSMKH